TRLLKDLVFAERGLAGTNLKWERRRAFVELGVAACGVAIVGLASLAWLISVLTLSQTRATADGSVPWSYKFGLYQGGKLEDASEHAYQRLLQATFLP